MICAYKRTDPNEYVKQLHTLAATITTATREEAYCRANMKIRASFIRPNKDVTFDESVTVRAAPLTIELFKLCTVRQHQRMYWCTVYILAPTPHRAELVC